MLGHKSATMTLDLYGHLFPDRLDEVADALDLAARAVVAPCCPAALSSILTRSGRRLQVNEYGPCKRVPPAVSWLRT